MDKTIKIGYQDYQVKLVDHEVVMGLKSCYGAVDYNNQVISISTIYPLDRQKAALLHEAIHALDHIFNIGLEEEEVELLGTALAGLFKDNPNFVGLLDRDISPRYLDKEEVAE